MINFPMQCNIDAKGKSVRLIYGLALFAAGMVLLFTWAIGGGVIAWLITIGLILSGGFMIFESRAGWCVIRAMGFKTPI
ncbi:MAG TPA: hypothetical protein VKK61_08060 [Tepidisphaeraceae bacterium]|nr:hypothetical protein [Tepidisphaeraceae bacterium]